MNIYDQMQAQAEQIVPGVKLSDLLVSSGPRKKICERRKIAKLVRSGEFYMSPSWLGYYYSISASTLEGIRNNHNRELDKKV